jgi:DNA-directed RNA polymerase specialized sigma24 family protein
VTEETASSLLSRLRHGDRDAAAELVRRYEPQIRLEVRLRLRDRRLRRLFDSIDICQSVLSSFLVRAMTGVCELERPEELLKFLVAMTRNKLAMAVRRQRAGRRDHRRLAEDDPATQAAIAPGASPSDEVAGEELIREFRLRLTEEERLLASRRAESWEWAAIATEFGGTAEGRRKQLERAVERVSRELGLEDAGLD